MTPTFIMQSAISSVVLGFALFQFANASTSSDKPIYASWVGLVVGYWLPSPNNRKEDETNTLTYSSQTTFKKEEVQSLTESEE